MSLPPLIGVEGVADPESGRKPLDVQFTATPIEYDRIVEDCTQTNRIIEGTGTGDRIIEWGI